MDLRSMLNENAPAAKPPPTADPSLHRPSQTSHEQLYRERPGSHVSPIQPLDVRSPGSGGGGSGGSYFGSLQSPYQNTSATPSASTHSVHSQSPGIQSQLNTPKDGFPTHHSYNAQSPSGFPPQSQTSSGPYYNNQFHHQTPTQANAPSNSHSSREYSVPANGTSRSNSRQLSPEAQHLPQPSTPLGPPAPFPKPQSQSHRPSSQGYDHYRTYSSSSVHSQINREVGQTSMPSPDQLRRESLQRPISIDRERERSVSVSPKTIPRPSPHRQPSSEGHLQTQVTPMAQIQENGHAKSPQAAIMSVEGQQHTPSPFPSHATPKEAINSPQVSSTRPSPSPVVNQFVTPKSANASLPHKPSPYTQSQPSLKRTASVVSGTSTSSQPARKRLRRDDIPIFARSARPNNPPRLTQGSNAPIQYHVTPSSRPQMARNGHSTTPVSAPTLVPGPRQETFNWEVSITNKIPYEDLTRRICDWIVHHIGMAAPPSGGAVFEIEAKIGEIFDIDHRGRIDLPVDTEALFNKDKYRRTKFESSMNMLQHKQLNDFLNKITEQSNQEAQTTDREPIYFDHPKEYDEFFELKPVGLTNLSPSLRQYINPRHTPKVRKTTDLNKNQVKAQIIKSRIADLDIYNPGSEFDYRISISIESPWEGNPEWLEPLGEGGRDRIKDRMSYRHGPYQIDLTQVSYTNKVDREHELEVEISTEMIRRELDNLRTAKNSRYEELVKGFVDNVRILCRQATLQRIGRE